VAVCWKSETRQEFHELGMICLRFLLEQHLRKSPFRVEEGEEESREMQSLNKEKEEKKEELLNLHELEEKEKELMRCSSVGERKGKEGKGRERRRCFGFVAFLHYLLLRLLRRCVSSQPHYLILFLFPFRSDSAPIFILAFEMSWLFTTLFLSVALTTSAHKTSSKNQDLIDYFEGSTTSKSFMLCFIPTYVISFLFLSVVQFLHLSPSIRRQKAANGSPKVFSSLDLLLSLNLSFLFSS
jgi:hypothetical protein